MLSIPIVDTGPIVDLRYSRPVGMRRVAARPRRKDYNHREELSALSHDLHGQPSGLLRFAIHDVRQSALVLGAFQPAILKL